MADPSSRRGVRYTSAQVLEWVNGIHAAHDTWLGRAFEAPEREGLPAIQVGPAEGRTLELLCRLAGVERAVEVGTLTGYSALWIARALPSTGSLWTIETEPAHADVAEDIVRDAGLADRVRVCRGAALEVLPELEAHGPFDAAFVDADKGNYLKYGRWAARNLRPGGLLLADNAFFFGHLLDDSTEAAEMRRFHEETARQFDTACIPTPDGLLVGIRR